MISVVEVAPSSFSVEEVASPSVVVEFMEQSVTVETVAPDVVDVSVESSIVTVETIAAPSVEVSVQAADVVAVELGTSGPQGPPGPPGPAGGVVSVSGPLILDSVTGALSLDGAAFSSTHVQTGPASVWEIDHSVSFYPNVTVVDSGGNAVIGDIDYVSPTHLTITFASAFAGIAYLS